MSELSDYIASGSWIEFFNEAEVDHVLTFSYNLIQWIERDGADMLERRPNEFVWSKGQKIVGVFPITVPEPIPSFVHTLLVVFERDKILQEYLNATYEGDGVFRIRRRT